GDAGGPHAQDHGPRRKRLGAGARRLLHRAVPGFPCALEEDEGAIEFDAGLLTIPVRGRGVEWAVELGTGTLDFGTVEVGTVGERVIAVTNTARTELEVYVSLSDDGAFS